MTIDSTCKVCRDDFSYEQIDGFPDLHLGVCSDICAKKMRDLKFQRIREANKRAFEGFLPDLYKNDIDGNSAPADLKDFCHIDGLAKTCRGWAASNHWAISFFSDTSGTGKTRIGLAILKELNQDKEISSIDRDGGYYKAGEIGLACDRHKYNESSKVIESFWYRDFLMIDDLGDEKEAHSFFLTQIIQKREERRKKTIITSNLDLKQITKRYDNRVVSRIKATYIELKTKDMRHLK